VVSLGSRNFARGEGGIKTGAMGGPPADVAPPMLVGSSTAQQNRMHRASRRERDTASRQIDRKDPGKLRKRIPKDNLVRLGGDLEREERRNPKRSKDQDADVWGHIGSGKERKKRKKSKL